MIQALGDPLAAADRGDAVFATQVFQDNTDFILGGMVVARGAARRMSLIVFSAADVCGPDFCLIFASFDRATMSRKSSLLN